MKADKDFEVRVKFLIELNRRKKATDLGLTDFIFLLHCLFLIFADANNPELSKSNV